MTVAEVIDVTRRARSLASGRFARFNSRRFPRALQSFSTMSVTFRGHKFVAAVRRNDKAKLFSAVVMSTRGEQTQQRLL
jgi:hypothetical protein